MSVLDISHFGMNYSPKSAWNGGYKFRIVLSGMSCHSFWHYIQRFCMFFGFLLSIDLFNYVMIMAFVHCTWCMARCFCYIRTFHLLLHLVIGGLDLKITFVHETESPSSADSNINTEYIYKYPPWYWALFSHKYSKFETFIYIFVLPPPLISSPQARW